MERPTSSEEKAGVGRRRGRRRAKKRPASGEEEAGVGRRRARQDRTSAQGQPAASEGRGRDGGHTDVNAVPKKSARV